MIFLLILVFFSGISYASVYKTYVIDHDEVKENKFLTFNIPHKATGRQKLSCLIRQKEAKRRYYLKLEEDKKELEKCLRKITKNWKRNIAPNVTIEDKWIAGYYGEEDKKFERKLWNKLRRGEKIC